MSLPETTAARASCIRARSVGQMIESFMVTPDKLEAMGLPADALPQGHWVGFHIPDADIFSKIKDGTYSSFSIQGDADP